MTRQPGRFILAALVGIAALVGAQPARAVIVSHVVDGVFTSPAEWAGPNVARFDFPVVGVTGGSVLYVEQQGSTLYLMYDYFNSPSLGLTPANAAFDVFFQVGREQADYAVHITGSSFQAYEKPSAVISPLNADGSLNLSGPPWTPLSSADLALAQFVAAIGSGPSPDHPGAHVMAEFALSINRNGEQNPNGIYDPAPAFWSASAKAVGGPGDPPISSAIFQLNPDGSTIVAPVFGANGGPALQPQDVVVPEPSSVLLCGIGLLSLAIAGRARRRPGA